MTKVILANGKFSDSLLMYLGWPEADHLRLVPAAAKSINRLAAAFETEFSKPLYLSDAYRTYAQQVYLKKIKGVFAATPGKSNHGLGVAIDMASRINIDGSDEHKWMERNGPWNGWVNPYWAVDYNPSNGQHEPWHWEYIYSMDKYLFTANVPVLSVPVIIKEDEVVPFIQALYMHYCGRIASAGELITTAKQAQNSGWSYAQLEAAFIANPAERGTIISAFLEFLGTAPNESQINDWSKGLSIKAVFYGIENSPAAIARR